MVCFPREERKKQESLEALMWETIELQYLGDLICLSYANEHEHAACQNLYSLKREHLIRFLTENEKYSLRLSADMIK